MTSAALERSHGVGVAAALAARRPSSAQVTLIALGIATGLSALELGAVLWRLGGHFSFSLDDPYIHLALADHIAQGHYGLNGIEPAAPSSSILYPVLLAAVGFSGLGQFASLVLCFVATLWSSGLIAKLLERSLPTGGLTWAAATLLPLSLILSLNLVGIEFTGLEHSLHVAVTLACLLGAIEFLETNRIAPWWWVCGLVEPLIRYEGASLWLGMAILMLGHRRWLPGLALLTAGVVLLGLFSLFLHSLGLAWLPSSVMVKSYVAAAGAEGAPGGLLAGLRGMLADNFGSFGMVRLSILCVALSVFLVDRGRVAPGRRDVIWQLAALALFASLAHILLGRFGWLSRYEIYVVAFDLMVLVYGFGPRLGPVLVGATPARLTIVALCPMAFLNAYAQTAVMTPLAARNIYDQQYQMHRFVDEVYRRPVGVNDLGWVAYGSPTYVLDFWGLGSESARRLRTSDESGRWMDDLAVQHGVGLAMIYADWFDRVPERWQVVARLAFTAPRVSAASDEVTFYATSAEARAPIVAALHAFAPTLPADTSLVFAPAP